MESVDYSVNESKNMVSFDRSPPELKGLSSSNFDFRIESSGGDQIAVLEIRNSGGQTIRRTESGPFSTGTLAKKSMDVNKQNCNVTFRKSSPSVRIGDYF